VPHLSPGRQSAFYAGHRPATPGLGHTGVRHCFQRCTHPKKPSSWVLERSRSDPQRAQSPDRASAPCVKPHRRGQIAIAHGNVPASLPAGSFPGGFRTTAPVPAESSRWAVIRNPSHKLKFNWIAARAGSLATPRHSSVVAPPQPRSRGSAATQWTRRSFRRSSIKRNARLGTVQLAPNDRELPLYHALIRSVISILLLEPIQHLPHQFGLSGRNATFVNTPRERPVEGISIVASRNARSPAANGLWRT
jgi:hypothetical protein